MTKFLLRLSLSLLVIALAVIGTLAVVFYVQNMDLNTKLSRALVDFDTAKQEATDLRTENQHLAEDLDLAMESCFEESSDGFLIIGNPCDHSVLGSEFQVKGMAFGLFENNVAWEVKDADGTQVDTGFFTLTGEFARPNVFTQNVTWEKPATAGNGELTFFTTSAADGSRNREVTLEVSWE